MLLNSETCFALLTRLLEVEGDDVRQVHNHFENRFLEEVAVKCLCQLAVGSMHCIRLIQRYMDVVQTMHAPSHVLNYARLGSFESAVANAAKTQEHSQSKAVIKQRRCGPTEGR